MSRSFKVAALCAVTALVLAMPLAAQNATEELGPLESNTYKATSGLFGNDVDNFVDVHSYGDVAPEKWFGFVTGRALTVKGAESSGWIKPEGVEWDGNKWDASKSDWGAYKDPTGFLPDNPTTGLLSLGYARNLGGIYLGLWYQGNIAQVTGGFDTKTSKITPTYDAYRTVTKTVTETTWSESWLNTSNQIEALIGVSGQGIKVGFYESMFSNVHEGAAWRVANAAAGGAGNPDGQNKDRFSSSDSEVTAGTKKEYDLKAPVTKVTNNQDGTVTYENATDEFYTKGGYIKPYLGWGSTFAVGANSLRPFVNLGATFKSDTKVDNYSNYTVVNGKKYGKTNSVDNGYDFSYIKPEVGIGAWVDLAAAEGAKASSTVGFEYNLGVYIYNSSYAGTGLAGDNVAGTVGWPGIWTDTGGNDYRRTKPAVVNQKTNYVNRTTTHTEISLDIDELTEMRHEIKPTYILSGEAAENLSLGFKLSLPVGVRTYSSDKHTEKYTINITKYNTDTARNTKDVEIYRSGYQSFEETDLSVDLNLAIGASYKLVPNRLSVNAGVSATPIAFTNTVRTYKQQANKDIWTKKVTDGLGNVTTDQKTVNIMDGSNYDNWLVQVDQVNSNTTWDGFSGNVTGGFTFFFTPGIALDLAAAWGRDSFNVDIADVNVLFSFKF